MHPSTQQPPHVSLWRRGSRTALGDSPRVHEELVVLLGIEGHARYIIGSLDTVISPGVLLFAPPGTAHMLLSTEPGFDMWVVLAHPLTWGPYPPDCPTGARRMNHTAQFELDSLGRQIEPLPPEDRGHGLRWWITRARHLWNTADLTETARLHPAVARAAMILERSPEIALATLAKSAGISASHLGQLFPQQIGQTITEFRNARRLSNVDDLVSNGMPLLSAALDAGFGSYSQFFRVFAAARKMSPRAWYKET